LLLFSITAFKSREVREEVYIERGVNEIIAAYLSRHK
jgi:hypothetical protein